MKEKDKRRKKIPSNKNLEKSVTIVTETSNSEEAQATSVPVNATKLDSSDKTVKAKLPFLGKKRKQILAYLLAIVWAILGLILVFIIGKATNTNAFKSELPIVIIDTGGHKLNNKDPTQVNARVIYNVAGNPNYINSLASHFNGGVGMRLRGDSTKELQDITQFHRYTFETRHSSGEDMNFPLFGLPEESDWMLEGPITDETAIANMLALELSNQLGYYAPRTKFVEVFYSDDKNIKAEDNYVGVFMFSEKVKKDKERVDIEDLPLGNKADDNLSGGHLLELTSIGEIKEKDAWFETDFGTKIINAYPKVSKLTEPQQQWIREYVNDFEQALYKHPMKPSESKYSDYIDTQSTIDYIIINDLFKNTDAFYENTFVTKDRDKKMFMGPVWDVVRKDSIDYEDEYSSHGFYLITGRWTEKLFADEEFAKSYIQRWKELRAGSLSDKNIDMILDVYRAKLKESNTTANVDQVINSLGTWLKWRTKWLDENIDWLLDKGDGKDLPVVVIDSRQKKITKKDGKKSVDIEIYQSDGTLSHYNNIVEFTENAPLLYDGVAGIVKRGQSSMAFDKLNFSMEFRDPYHELVQKNVQILGFPEDSDFVLHGPWSDKSLMRNAVVYDLWRDMGYYSPRTQFVELYINGSTSKNKDDDETVLSDSDYRGVYLLVEKIKRGKRRVDVAKQIATDINDPLMSGGFIYEKSKEGKKNPTDDAFKTAEVADNLYILAYPKNDNWTQEREDWIDDYVVEFEKVMYQPTTQEDIEKRYDYIDVQSWIDSILLQEFVKNIDGFSVSQYFHKDRYEKIQSGPQWDFNITLGNMDYDNECSEPEGWFIKGKSLIRPLFNDKKFTDQYIARWHELRETSLSDENFNKIVDNYSSQLSEAQKRNFERWPVIGVSIKFNNDKTVQSSYEGEVEYMRNWGLTRLHWIDANIDQLVSLYD